MPSNLVTKNPTHYIFRRVQSQLLESGSTAMREFLDKNERGLLQWDCTHLMSVADLSKRTYG